MTAARPTVYLHIGAMKTGTTFLQKFMSANQDSPGAAGVLVAGESTREQALAARDILHGAAIADPAVRAGCEGRWTKLRGEMPAQWQTLCRNGGAVPWPAGHLHVVTAHVVGSRDELPTDVPAEVRAAAPAELTAPRPREILGAAAAARDGLLSLLEVYQAELRTPQGASPDDTGPNRVATSTRPDCWREHRPPVKAAVGEVTDLVAQTLELRRRVVDLRVRAASRP